MTEIDTSRAAVEAMAKQLRGLERDMRPYADKTVGSIRIDLDEVRAIVGAAALLCTLADERDELLAENEIIQRSHKNVELEAADARAAAFEEAIKAVDDAGGDNTDYHIEAIRAAASQPEQTKERGDG